MMVVCAVWKSIFFLKKEKLSLTFIGKRPSVMFILISTASYLKPTKTRLTEFRCLYLCSDFLKFHHEINIFKNILYKHSYPRDFVDKCVKKFLERVLTQKVVVSTVPKKDLMVVLPHLGKLSLQIRTRINRVIKNKLPHCSFRIVFQIKCRLITFFTFKDKIPIFLRCL